MNRFSAAAAACVMAVLASTSAPAAADAESPVTVGLSYSDHCSLPASGYVPPAVEVHRGAGAGRAPVEGAHVQWQGSSPRGVEMASTSSFTDATGRAEAPALAGSPSSAVRWQVAVTAGDDTPLRSTALQHRLGLDRDHRVGLTGNSTRSDIFGRAKLRVKATISTEGEAVDGFCPRRVLVGEPVTFSYRAVGSSEPSVPYETATSDEQGFAETDYFMPDVVGDLVWSASSAPRDGAVGGSHSQPLTLRGASPVVTHRDLRPVLGVTGRTRVLSFGFSMPPGFAGAQRSAQLEFRPWFDGEHPVVLGDLTDVADEHGRFEFSTTRSLEAGSYSAHYAVQSVGERPAYATHGVRETFASKWPTAARTASRTAKVHGSIRLLGQRDPVTTTVRLAWTPAPSQGLRGHRSYTTKADTTKVFIPTGWKGTRYYQAYVTQRSTIDGSTRHFTTSFWKVRRR